jgi:hypothetical protein
MFGKVGKKINQVLGILELLPMFIEDIKTTLAVIQDDVKDLKTAQAVLTHQATVEAVVPAVVAAVLPAVAQPSGGFLAGLQKTVTDVAKGVIPK